MDSTLKEVRIRKIANGYIISFEGIEYYRNEIDDVANLIKDLYWGD